jgi:hypothetical protein
MCVEKEPSQYKTGILKYTAVKTPKNSNKES